MSHDIEEPISAPRVFVPHRQCTENSGACFERGKCLSACRTLQTKTHEKRIRELERRLAELEILVRCSLPQSTLTTPIVFEKTGRRRPIVLTSHEVQGLVAATGGEPVEVINRLHEMKDRDFRAVVTLGQLLRVLTAELDRAAT